jgi:hypothetical protein
MGPLWKSSGDIKSNKYIIAKRTAGESSENERFLKIMLLNV